MSTITEAQIDAYMAVQWRLAREYDRKQAQLSARERCRAGLESALAATGTPQRPTDAQILDNARKLEAERMAFQERFGLDIWAVYNWLHEHGWNFPLALASQGAAPTGAGDAEPSDEEKRKLIGGYFSEEWAVEHALGLLHHYRQMLYAAPQQPAEAAPGEIDALRANDAKYRWLCAEVAKHNGLTVAVSNGYELSAWSGDDLDRAIEAALANNKKGGEHA